MSVRYQIRCDGCGKRKFVKSLEDESLPMGWRSDYQWRYHACCKTCQSNIEQARNEAVGQVLMWDWKVRK